MNALLTLAARELVAHCTGKSDQEIVAACDGALHFLQEHGFSRTTLRLFPRAVRRELRSQAIPSCITTPRGEGGPAKARILSALTGALGTEVELSEEVDPALLGGATLAVGDERLDRSLRGALRQLECHLTM